MSNIHFNPGTKHKLKFSSQGSSTSDEIDIHENDMTVNLEDDAFRVRVGDGDSKIRVKFEDDEISVVANTSVNLENVQEDRKTCSNYYCYNWADECDKHD